MKLKLLVAAMAFAVTGQAFAAIAPVLPVTANCSCPCMTVRLKRRMSAIWAST